MGIGAATERFPTGVELLIGADEIQHRVRELGSVISERYANQTIVTIAVLNGAVVFLSDLIRHITVPMEIDFLAVSSYGCGTRSSGEVRVLKDIETDLLGRHVIIVEDIVDTGRTLAVIHRMLLDRKPASLATCVLLDKPARREVHVHIDHTAFTIPDRFVVGYGLDSAGYYRNLPYIGVVKS